MVKKKNRRFPCEFLFEGHQRSAAGRRKVGKKAFMGYSFGRELSLISEENK